MIRNIVAAICAAYLGSFVLLADRWPERIVGGLVLFVALGAYIEEYCARRQAEAREDGYAAMLGEAEDDLASAESDLAEARAEIAQRDDAALIESVRTYAASRWDAPLPPAPALSVYCPWCTRIARDEHGALVTTSDPGAREVPCDREDCAPQVAALVADLDSTKA